MKNFKILTKLNFHELPKAIKIAKKNYCTCAHVRNIQFQAVAWNRAYLIIERSL